MRDSSPPRSSVAGRRAFWALAVAVCLVATARHSRAGSGEVFRLPTSGAAPKNGLQLILDTRWVDGNGYMPVRVTVLPWPAGPATASRTIQVVLSPNAWGPYENYQVTGYVELAQGATRGEATLAVHQAGMSRTWGVKVYEDGVLLEDLSVSGMFVGRSYSEVSEAIPTLLLIDANAPTRDAREQLIRARNMAGTAPAATAAPLLPDLRQLPPSFSDPAEYGGSYGVPYSVSVSGGGSGVPPAVPLAPPVSGVPLAPPVSGVPLAPPVPPDDGQTLVSLSTMPHIELLSPAELPQRWIEFTCVDMIFVSAADLQSLVAQQPAVWQAIRQWLATGPTLCVYDMKLSPEELGRLESVLELSASSGDAPPGSVRAGWRAPDPRTATTDDVTALTGRLRNQYATYPPSYSQPASEAPVDQDEAPAPTPPAEAPFLVRDVDRGRVVAMSATEPLLSGRYGLTWLLNDLGSPTWMWYQRHGMSLFRPNNEYWNWVVPGIGLTPVGTFMVLIALFVVGIGPVNYYLLRRRRRLYMLLVTVPAGAALVTAALFAYALVCDGLSVRVRVRGWTQIDQRRGLTVSWSRQSYYAGVAPADGLRFPEHTAVYPIELDASDGGGNSRASRQLVWDGDQNLASGYLRSRSTSQLLVIDAAPSTGGLALVEGGTDPPSLQVTNQLPATLDQLAVWDSAGRCFWCEGLAPGATVAMTPTQQAAVSEKLQLILSQHRPAYPDGYDYYDDGWGGSRRYYGIRYYGNSADVGLPGPSFSTGILERGLTQAVSVSAPQPEPRSYVAVTHSTPGVPLGYGRAREEASIYVVQGKW